MIPPRTDSDPIASTIAGADSHDPPFCPSCNYLLIGLRSRVCPECGHALGHDLDQYRRSRLPTAWSEGKRIRIFRGLAAVFVHPVSTLEACGSPRRVDAVRAWLFALVCSTVLVAGWPVIREVGACISVSTKHGLSSGIWSRLPMQLGKFALWHRLWSWEAWSIARWWLLFGAIAVSIALIREQGEAWERSKLATIGVRLALFAPWIVVLELGYLAGVWIWQPTVAPEPSTIFATSLTIWDPVEWVIRGVLPSLLVGSVFFRAVVGLRSRASVCASLLFTPAAIYASIAWSVFYMDLFLH